MRVWMGFVDIDDTEGKISQIFNWQMRKHPSYNPGQAYFDVAVIFLDKSIKFDDTVRPICLPQSADPDPDNHAGQFANLIGKCYCSMSY